MNEKVDNFLLSNKDLAYKAFNDKIINTNLETIGVRMPILKKYAKDLFRFGVDEVLKEVKDDYYEKILLKGLIISKIKDVNVLITYLDSFLKLIDNWAICDCFCASLTCVSENESIFLNIIEKKLKSNNKWEVRFCFVLLLDYFVKERYLKLIFRYLDNDNNVDYYVMMAKAWLISECFIKYQSQTYEYLNNCKIDATTFNKAISKICDSHRVSKDDKIRLKQMKKMAKLA